MRSLLKALGVTIWGTVAFGLLLVFILVGYRAGLRYRPGSSPTETRELNGLPGGSQPVSPSHAAASNLPPPAAASSVPDRSATTSAATHALIRAAADQRQYDAALEYGKQLLDSGQAGPEDLQILAQAHYSTKGCADALTWVEEAIEAFRAANREPGLSLQQIKIRCAPAKPVDFTPEQRERTMRLLRSLKDHSEADRKDLPQLEDEAAKSTTGNLDVWLGEIYFGFGDYPHAIAAIQRGLGKGQVTHLDDAYVYLGRSLVAVKNYPEARMAFAKLKDVPGISPRILSLWELYAETLQ